MLENMKFQPEFHLKKKSSIYSFNLCWIFLTAILSTFEIEPGLVIYRRGIQQILDKYFFCCIEFANPSVANLMEP